MRGPFSLLIAHVSGRAGEAYCYGLGMTQPPSLTPRAWAEMALLALIWGALLYQGALATSLAYLLYYPVLAVAGSGNLMLVTLLLPPIAILLGALILGERIGLREWCGFAIIALGLIIIDGRAARWLRPSAR